MREMIDFTTIDPLPLFVIWVRIFSEILPVLLLFPYLLDYIYDRERIQF